MNKSKKTITAQQFQNIKAKTTSEKDHLDSKIWVKCNRNWQGKCDDSTLFKSQHQINDFSCIRLQRAIFLRAWCKIEKVTQLRSTQALKVTGIFSMIKFMAVKISNLYVKPIHMDSYKIIRTKL